jgi:hypothetical protein
MKSINRNVVIVKPKEPFLAWLQSLSSPPENLTLDELRRDSLCLLIPESHSEGAATGLISKHYKKLFEDELMAWHTVKRQWPKKRTLAMFREWFELEFHSEVVDLVDEPIEKEDYLG